MCSLLDCPNVVLVRIEYIGSPLYFRLHYKQLADDRRREHSALTKWKKTLMDSPPDSIGTSSSPADRRPMEGGSLMRLRYIASVLRPLNHHLNRAFYIVQPVEGCSSL